MCTNQEDIWVCEDCDHKDHTPAECTECDCYHCDTNHHEGWTGFCCHCGFMAAKHGCDDESEEDEE